MVFKVTDSLGRYRPSTKKKKTRNEHFHPADEYLLKDDASPAACAVHSWISADMDLKMYLVLFGALNGLLIFSHWLPAMPTLPDFFSFSSVRKEKKKTFMGRWR